MKINFSRFYVIIMALYILNGLSPITLKAQYEQVWAFGEKAGIDFNGAAPVSIQTAINTTEGSASVCDDQGKLLFYTDGNQVWNRNHKVMANGNDLPGMGVNVTFSTSQGSIIIPAPGDLDKYYVFSLGMEFGLNPTGKLFYSIVDMQLDNGLGDIVPGKKSILVDSLLTEHMTAAPGADCNIWLVVVDRMGQKFKAHRINIDGLQPNPTLSPRMAAEGIFQGILGCISISPDRKKLAIGQGNLYLYDFNVQNGMISNPLLLEKDILGSFYGTCFSPDNSKLYASTGSTLQQFDLSSGDPAIIAGSRYHLAHDQYFPTIKLGPDKRIYTAGNKSSLNLIEKPDLAGSLCNYSTNGFPLLPQTKSNLGLPNIVAFIPSRKQYSLRRDTLYCVDSFRLTPNYMDGRNYIWEDQDKNREKVVYQSGTYNVRYNRYNVSDCTEYIDSFQVVMVHSTFTNNTDILSRHCATDTFRLWAADTTGFDYIWDDGYRGTSRMIRQTGSYAVTYTLAPCQYYKETYKVAFPLKNPEVSFQVDSLVCVNQQFPFNNTAPSSFNNFSWHFGDGQNATIRHPLHQYQQPGKYEVMLIGTIDGICTDTTYKSITVDEQITDTFKASPTAICQGMPIQFSPGSIYPSIKNRIWAFGDGGIALTLLPLQHAYAENGLFPVTLTTQFRACPDYITTDTIRVFPLPVIDLGPDTTFCFRGIPLLLYNRQSAYGTIQNGQWNTGATTDTLPVRQPGIYSLSVSESPLGCTSTETVTIAKDCYMDIPNAFSPNGDGWNDYFSPTKLLARKLTRFKMQIWNRWGVLIFASESISGRGWDGKFNGKEQPPGVYTYLVQANPDGHAPEEYRGNVTLIR